MISANPNLVFSEVLDDIRDIVYGVWRYRWKGIGFVWVLCVLGWLLVMGLPDIYQGSSRVFIDTTSTLGKVLETDVVRLDAVSEANIMVRSLTSRPNLENLATRTGILVGGESASEVEAQILRLQNDLEITLDSGQVLQINYVNANSELALAVVSQLIDIFVEGLLASNRSDTDEAQEFLEDKIEDYEKLLRQAEARLADFKRKNIGQMPEERVDYYTRFQKAQEALKVLDFQLKLTKDRQVELSRQLSGETPVFGMTMPTQSAGNVESALGRQIRQFEQELAVLRIQYTDSHPDIVRNLAILEDLRAQEKEEQPTGPQFQGGSLNENPVYQSIKLQQGAVELKLIELQSKYTNQVRVVNDLRDKINVIPEIEAKLTRLNRDYEVNKAQHDALLRRLETARMTEAAENSKTQFNFRIMDPPVVSPDPVGPNRVLFITVVLVLSIGAGILLTMFLSFSRPVIFSLRGLEKRFGIPVVGGIGYIQSEAEGAAANLEKLYFACCFVAVLTVYGFVVSLSQAGANLVAELVTILRRLI